MLCRVPLLTTLLTLKVPVMLVFGDSEMYRPEHIVEFYKLLGGGQKDRPRRSLQR
jgi:hypothetical protein